jgi:hypothetical protein
MIICPYFSFIPNGIFCLTYPISSMFFLAYFIELVSLVLSHSICLSCLAFILNWPVLSCLLYEVTLCLLLSPSHSCLLNRQNLHILSLCHWLSWVRSLLPVTHMSCNVSLLVTCQILSVPCLRPALSCLYVSDLGSFLSAPCHWLVFSCLLPVTDLSFLVCSLSPPCSVLSASSSTPFGPFWVPPVLVYSI